MRGTDARRGGLAWSHGVSTAAYVATLLYLSSTAAPPLPIAAIGSMPVRLLSVVSAFVTFPVSILVSRRGYGPFGSVVCGIIGAFAGRGALVLPTLSAALGFEPWISSLVSLVLQAMVLTAVAQRDGNGLSSRLLEILGAAVLAVMAIAPTLTFAMLNFP